MLLAVGIIHAFGVLQLMLLLGVGPIRAFALGSLPFLVGDGLKCLIAASLTAALLPGRTLAKEAT
jgi:biotin transporter BioY